MAILAVYRQARQQRAAALGTTLTGEGFVFSPSADGGSWRQPASLTRQYHRLVSRLGIHTTPRPS